MHLFRFGVEKKGSFAGIRMGQQSAAFKLLSKQQSKNPSSRKKRKKHIFRFSSSVLCQRSSVIGFKMGIWLTCKLGRAWVGGVVMMWWGDCKFSENPYDIASSLPLFLSDHLGLARG